MFFKLKSNQQCRRLFLFNLNCYNIKYRFSSSRNVPNKPRRHTRISSMQKPNRKSTISTEQFGNKSRQLLNLLYFGVKDIEDVDDNVKIDYYLHNNDIIKDDKILNIHIETIGSFQVLIDDKKSQIQLFSPLSFTNIYIYNEAYQEWQSTIDGHNIIELIARELNDHCKGYPKF